MFDGIESASAMRTGCPRILVFVGTLPFIMMTRSPAQTPLARLIEKERIVESSPPPNQSWMAAEVGRELVKREKVAVRDLSRAAVRLSNEHVIRLNANSEIVLLPSLIQDKPLGLELQKGEIYLHSRGLPAELGLKTPVVQGTPRGTQFRVRVEGDGTTTFTMFEGEVELTNEHGRLRLGNSEQAVVEPGRAPRRTAVIEAKNTIQWCLYYPGVLHLPELELAPPDRNALRASIAAYGAGDLLGALDHWPAGHRSGPAGVRVFRAMVLLAVGQTTDARRSLAGVPADAPGRRAIEEMMDAVNFIERPEGPEPQTASEWLAHSYYEQSRSRLESALEAARMAVTLAPSSGYAAARVADLEFSFGRTSAALRELERGMKLSPRNAQAHALRGFLLSAQNRIDEAREAFDEAISLDGALGNAWLGRGLCAIRQGRTDEGRRDLQTATVLEPNRAIFHSYLGKAASQAGLNDAARHDFDFAKQIDPRDPTPWLYSAVQKSQENRYNGAIDDLARSVDLNENRRVYRSRFLLDQDLSVRNANLAALYRNNGMTDLSVREATQAVENNYTNASAHLFLANSFDALRDPTRIQLRYETAWFNELLLANLLSPVGGGPLSQFVSQQE
jgi:tetratricopeptide (TPR) repeat protein